jgi:hypothetical protein
MRQLMPRCFLTNWQLAKQYPSCFPWLMATMDSMDSMDRHLDMKVASFDRTPPQLLVEALRTIILIGNRLSHLLSTSGSWPALSEASEGSRREEGFLSLSYLHPVTTIPSDGKQKKKKDTWKKDRSLRRHTPAMQLDGKRSVGYASGWYFVHERPRPSLQQHAASHWVQLAGSGASCTFDGCNSVNEPRKDGNFLQMRKSGMYVAVCGLSRRLKLPV